jgi:D-Tyr-tRNAtyr deacylase
VQKILDWKLWPLGKEEFKLSVIDQKLEILVISNYTLFASKQGDNMEFKGAMSANKARPLYEKFVECLKTRYASSKIQTGRFGEHMKI